jgi:hypothetical protein
MKPHKAIECLLLLLVLFTTVAVSSLTVTGPTIFVSPAGTHDAHPAFLVELH